MQTLRLTKSKPRLKGIANLGEILCCVSHRSHKIFNLEKKERTFLLYLNLVLRFWKAVDTLLRGEGCNDPRIKAQQAKILEPESALRYCVTGLKGVFGELGFALGF
jgi:hypothetical protein